MAEEWRSVPGYEGLYSVSNCGRVRTERIGRSPHPDRLIRVRLRRGYREIRLYREGRPRFFRVARLVAAAFIGPAPAGHEVNHIDLVTENDAASNLEYLTGAENCHHAIAHGHWHWLHTPLSADRIKAIHTARQSGSSIREVARQLGLGVTTVTKYSRGLEAPNAMGRKLSSRDVQRMRSLRSEGRSISVLASEFQVGASTVYKILTGQRYKDIQ